MRLTDLNDFEIAMRLDELAKHHEVKLSCIHKSIYIALLRFCEEKGEYDENKGRYYINLSVNEILVKCKAGHTAVMNALNLLSGCGAVVRVKSSSVKSGGTNSKINTNKNKTFITYINTDFLSKK